MTTGLSLGTSTDKWQMWQQEQMNAAKAKMNKSGYVSKTDSSNNTQQVKVTKTSENTCTDGNDDGKIGFFAAAGHALKGAAKGLWNGIKGCFTNSEGKFSLGKTLLTVGVGALCIAFPAVGLVACGIGAVSGAITIGRGVKGIIEARENMSDAQAKDAWENIGDGAFTVATSVAGASASLKAVKATSTSGITNADDALKAIDKLDDAAKAKASFMSKIDDIDDLNNLSKADLSKIRTAAKEVGADTSKLGNLAEDATKLDKAKALLSDMGSSTKNQGVKVWAKGTELRNEAKLDKEAKAYNENMGEKSTLETKKLEAGLSPEEQTRLDELDKITKVDDSVKAQAELLKQKASLKETLAADVDEQKGIVDALENKLKEIKKTKDEASIEVAKQWLQEEKATLNQMKKDNSTFGQLTNKARTAANDTINKSETVKYVQGQKAAMTEGLSKKSILHPIDTAKQIKESLKAADFANLKSALSNDGKAILTALKDGTKTYNQLAREYGYNNVIEVMEAAQGYMYAKESV